MSTSSRRTPPCARSATPCGPSSYGTSSSRSPSGLVVCLHNPCDTRRGKAERGSGVQEEPTSTAITCSNENSEKVFASQERMSGFPEKGAALRGSPGNFRGSPGNFRGSLGRNPWIAVKFHSERTSGEVAEKLPGKFGELPGKSGDFPEARGSLTPSQRLAKFVSKK